MSNREIDDIKLRLNELEQEVSVLKHAYVPIGFCDSTIVMVPYYHQIIELSNISVDCNRYFYSQYMLPMKINKCDLVYDDMCIKRNTVSLCPSIDESMMQNRFFTSIFIMLLKCKVLDNIIIYTQDHVTILEEFIDEINESCVNDIIIKNPVAAGDLIASVINVNVIVASK